MVPGQPPEILRKSHAHTPGRKESRARRDIDDAIGDSSESEEQGLLIDLDGVVYRGDDPIDGAVAALHWLEDMAVPHLFVTNTSSRPRSALVEKLEAFGIRADIDDILAPPDAAAGWLGNAGCQRLKLFVPEVTRSVFSNFEVVSHDDPAPVDAVVVGDFGDGWNAASLNAAFRSLISEPAPRLVALGMTRYWHGPQGLRLDAGPFVKALSYAAGIEPAVLGKPAAEFFEAACQRLGVQATNAYMIGDDIKTDVAAAQAVGLTGILVRTGKFRPEDLDRGIRPHIIIDSIADLPRVWSEQVLT